MADSQHKCLMILSYKSSGSSACQNLLAQCSQIQHVVATRHQENETLYWTKAASILDLPQSPMLDSEVPIPAAKARTDLTELLQNNLDDYVVPVDDRQLIFGGWERLCHRFAPIFLEKSPHHVCQWSALELIVECIQRLPDIEFHFVGLIRNPMATLYSVWQRWRIPPELAQYEWLQAYRNLRRFQETVGSMVSVIRYEDMVSDIDVLHPVLDFVGCEQSSVPVGYLHPTALAKWRADRLFGYRPSRSVLELAQTYGYQEADLCNNDHLLWPAYRTAIHAYRRTQSLVGQTWRTLLH